MLSLTPPTIHERRAMGAEPILHATNNDLLRVDPEDYFLISRHRWQPHGRRKSGALYYAAPLGTGVVYLGHLVLPRPNGDRDLVQIHLNDDPRDARKENLAWVVPAVVRHRTERPKRRPGSSIYRGVRREAASGRFVASITVGRKKHRLGSFTREFDAALAYNEAATRIYGRFARLNDLREAETASANGRPAKLRAT